MCDVAETVYDRKQHVGLRTNAFDLVFRLRRTPAALIQELSGDP
jgi:hypothetical protein